MSTPRLDSEARRAGRTARRGVTPAADDARRRRVRSLKGPDHALRALRAAGPAVSARETAALADRLRGKLRREAKRLELRARRRRTGEDQLWVDYGWARAALHRRRRRAGDPLPRPSARVAGPGAGGPRTAPSARGHGVRHRRQPRLLLGALRRPGRPRRPGRRLRAGAAGLRQARGDDRPQRTRPGRGRSTAAAGAPAARPCSTGSRPAPGPARSSAAASAARR